MIKRIIKMMMIISLLSITGCKKIEEGAVFEFSYPSYENADSYSIGNFSYQSKKVSKVIVDWCVGSVEIVSIEGNECSVKENEELQEDYKLRWMIQDDTLTIRYCESNVKGTLSHDEDKSVYIEIPKGITLEVKNSTGDIKLTNVEAVSTIIDDQVGTVEAENLVTDTINCNVDVGTITLEQLSFKEGQLTTDTGEVNVSLKDGIGATIHYQIEVGEYNNTDQEGDDVIGDGANELTISVSVGTITVK